MAEHYSSGYAENEAPRDMQHDPTSQFMRRMQDDMTKRENKKQINELKKTAKDDPRMMKRIEAWEKEAAKPTARGGKKQVDTTPTPLQILGSWEAKVDGPKIVTHSQTKLNSNKQWNADTWSKSTYIF